MLIFILILLAVFAFGFTVFKKVTELILGVGSKEKRDDSVSHFHTHHHHYSVENNLNVTKEDLEELQRRKNDRN